MHWKKLLSAKRFGESSFEFNKVTRSRFEQDYDRIIFSNPFRMLQDKTQVFPLPEDDFVHTRLTHSLEVSSVGRSLGKEVGKVIIDRWDLEKEGISQFEFGSITSAASLAHDLGNPPFGHSGEEGISAFFNSTAAGQQFEGKVSEKEWSDLNAFEGNAQGFRILNSPTYGGLKLTYATLASFTKYPKSSSSSSESGRKSQKKYGFTQNESDLFKEIAEETGLIPLGNEKWCRHPLAFLVEAADDICYHIIDLEDGTRLGLASFRETKELLAEIIGDKFSEKKLDQVSGLNEKLGVLRAMAIGSLINQTVGCFLDHEESILSGHFDQSLVDTIPSSTTLREIINLSIDKIYRSRIVLERETAGFEVIEKLMERFSLAMYFKKFESSNYSPKYKSVFRLLPETYQIYLQNDGLSIYQSLQIITDFISSLTDSRALKLYRTISGFPLH